MSINVSAFIASLRFMVEGWLGIFIVMGIIIACIQAEPAASRLSPKTLPKWGLRNPRQMGIIEAVHRRRRRSDRSFQESAPMAERRAACTNRSGLPSTQENASPCAR